MFVHVMKGDNDDVLEWPFRGKIVITIKNRDETRLLKEDFCETMSTPEPPASAFYRTQDDVDRNPVGFGIQNFIRINALYTGGYVNTIPVQAGTADDKLVIKAHVFCSTED